MPEILRCVLDFLSNLPKKLEIFNTESSQVKYY